jgi:hypothetical protein
VALLLIINSKNLRMHYLITFMILFLAAVRDLDLVTAQTIMRNAKGAKSLMALASAERLSNLPVALADEM